MLARILIAGATVALGLVGAPSATPAHADPDPLPCQFTLSPPHVVQVSGRAMVTATLQPAACPAGGDVTSSVACVQMQGSPTAELCEKTDGPRVAQVYYAPYRPGAVYTATGRGCASTGNPPHSVCQTTGPLTATL